MLSSLTIRNYALAEHLELDVARGFTVITGETGAGKSIMLDALGLCLGDKADGGSVRHGADKAELIALFDLQQRPEVRDWLGEHDLTHGDECSLRRVIHKEGRSKAWINGTPVTLGELRTLGELLISIHSQHAQQVLPKKETHRELLDDAGGLRTLAREVAQAFRDWQQAERNLADSRHDQAARQARLELLESYLDELRKLGLKAGEYEQLEQEYDRLAHFEALMQDGQQALALLSEGDSHAMQQVQQTVRLLDSHRGRDERLANVCTSLGSALIELREAGSELQRFLDSQELDPARLQWLENRLSEIHRLARKHRVLPAELPALQSRWQDEHERSQQAQDSTALRTAVDVAIARYQQLAGDLRERRQQVAPQLAATLATHLHGLGMPETRIVFAFSALTRPAAYGLDDVELLFSANRGMEPQALGKVVSGGELSRLGLAVQVIQAQHSAVPVLVFDEVDVGISGATAEVVGKLLRQLGEQAQILCITHQPQVAAQGHQHWHVEKHTQDQHTQSQVRLLDREARVLEIARMSGGITLTPETLRHAASMLA